MSGLGGEREGWRDLGDGVGIQEGLVLVSGQEENSMLLLPSNMKGGVLAYEDRLYPTT